MQDLILEEIEGQIEIDVEAAGRGRTERHGSVGYHSDFQISVKGRGTITLHDPFGVTSLEEIFDQVLEIQNNSIDLDYNGKEYFVGVSVESMEIDEVGHREYSVIRLVLDWEAYV